MAPLAELGLRARRLRLHDLHRQQRAARRAGRARRSRPTSWWSPPSCRATATSRAGSTRWCGRRTSPRRRWSSRTRWPGGWTSTSPRSRWARRSDGTPVFARRPLAQRRRRSARSWTAAIDPALFRDTYAVVFEGDEHVALAADPRGRPVRLGPGVDLHREPAVLRGPDRRAGAAHRHRRRPGAGGPRRLGDDRPHQPGRLDRRAGPPPAPGSRSTASAPLDFNRTAPAAATTR